MQDTLGRHYTVIDGAVYVKCGSLAENETLKDYIDKQNSILSSLSGLIELGTKLRGLNEESTSNR